MSEKKEALKALLEQRYTSEKVHVDDIDQFDEITFGFYVPYKPGDPLYIRFNALGIDEVVDIAIDVISNDPTYYSPDVVFDTCYDKPPQIIREFLTEDNVSHELWNEFVVHWADLEKLYQHCVPDHFFLEDHILNEYGDYIYDVDGFMMFEE